MFKRKESSLTTTIEFKLRVNQKFVATCEMVLEACRTLYNCALEHRISRYRYVGQSISFYEQSAELTELRKEMPEMKAVLRQIQMDVLKRLQKAYNAFFERAKLKKQGLWKKKAGFPRFKSKLHYNSFSQAYERQRGCPLKNDKLMVPGIGSVRVRNARPLPGTVKELRILRRADGWYVQLICATQPQPLPSTGKTVGVDLNIENTATLSEGTVFPNQRFLRKNARKLKKSQQKLARKQKGSANREKQRQKVARLHLHIQRCRHNYAHQISHHLIKYFDVIWFENLKILNLARNTRLAKHILDVGWGLIQQFTEGKAASAGREVKYREPHYTSQTCSHCGHRQAIPLSERTFTCERCGKVINRDHNAAINIQLGVGHTEFTPVESLTAADENASLLQVCSWKQEQQAEQLDRRIRTMQLDLFPTC